jgi:hypothetical protein
MDTTDFDINGTIYAPTAGSAVPEPGSVWMIAGALLVAAAVPSRRLRLL